MIIASDNTMDLSPWRKPRQDDADEDLRRRQREHLEDVMRGQRMREVDCLHNACSNCIGTGIGKDGRPCVHALSCPCARCTPRC